MKGERYFIIAGFVTSELHKVISTHKRAEKVIKLRKGIPLSKNVELKSSRISIYQQGYFLNELFSVNSAIPIAVVIDKYKLEGFHASENLAYNDFVKCLLRYLIICDVINSTCTEIELRLDNRNVSVKHLMDLETFLNWEFIAYNFKIKVRYLDSKYNRDVQMADYVANYLWKKYNKRGLKLIDIVNSDRNIYISRFPYKFVKKSVDILNYNGTM